MKPNQNTNLGVSGVIEVKTENNRRVTFSVVNLFNKEEVEWRLGLALKQLHKDLIWQDKKPPTKKGKERI